MIWRMDVVNTRGQMATPTKVIGKTINRTEKESSSSRMATSMEGIGKTIRDMEKESIHCKYKLFLILLQPVR